MKKHLYIVLFLTLFVLNGNAQDPNLIPLALNTEEQVEKSGVYMTYNDYKRNKLTYEADCKTEKRSIRSHEFLNQSFITVKHKEEKIKLQKDSIYGILNCGEPLVRFQDKQHFILDEKGSIWIFHKEVSVPQTKGVKLEKQYYFSSKGDGKLIELTINNIKGAFPDNDKLHDMIDAQFQNIDISEYDTYHKMFKINHTINSVNNECACPMHSDTKGKCGDKCSRCGKNLEAGQ